MNTLPAIGDKEPDVKPAKEVIVPGPSNSKGYCLAGGTCVSTHNVPLHEGAKEPIEPTKVPEVKEGKPKQRLRPKSIM